MEIINVPLKDNSITREIAYNINDFPYEKFNDCEIVTKKGKHGYSAYNIPAAFDIETTTIEPHFTYDNHGKKIYDTPPFGFMYHWQFCLIDTVVFGRTWEEFQCFLARLKKAMTLNDKQRLVIYVHNLSFEFQFMQNFITVSDLFAKDERKPLKLSGGGFEWRCSYFLSNMSLKKFCENTKTCVHMKLNGEEFNYKKIRTPKTPLTEYEKGYNYNDVRGLCECIAEKLVEYDILRIPLTSTGYVRNDFRKAVTSNPENRAIFLSSSLSPEEYTQCRDAVTGGVAHANRFYANQILYELHSRDIQSSYPYQSESKLFPVGGWSEVGIESKKELDFLCENYACIFTVRFFDIETKPNTPIPYISISKCKEHCDILNDNGKLLSAKEIMLTITDVDYKIIKEVYKIRSFQIVKFMYCRKERMSLEYRQQNLEFYEAKTKLKGIESAYYEYMKSKNKLNGAYGMEITDICHDIINWSGGEWSSVKADADKLKKDLESFYKSQKNFLIYQQGVFVPAYGRAQLYDAIRITGKDTVYVDTDSDKYFNDHELAFEEYNRKLIEEAKKSDTCLVAKNSKGQLCYAGIFEKDAEYKTFKTLGAKKYCYETFDKKKSKYVFGITVAGMSKEKGAKAVGNVGNFKIGNTFENVGRSTAYYNDTGKIFKITVIGDTFTTSSNIGIVETTYTLGVTDEYSNIIMSCQKIKDFEKNENNS